MRHSAIFLHRVGGCWRMLDAQRGIHMNPLLMRRMLLKNVTARPRLSRAVLGILLGSGCIPVPPTSALAADFAHVSNPTPTYTLLTEPDEGLTSIYNLISSARKTIDMTMYELSDTT